MLEMSGTSASDSSAPTVIGTKLRAPSPRPEQVVRPRLLKMLDEGLAGKVTLISAPAGYGKTILLSQWLNSGDKGGSFAWVALDEQDNDPIRLWRHIIESSGQSVGAEGFGAAVLAALSVAGTRVVDTVVPMLVNELSEVCRKGCRWCSTTTSSRPATGVASRWTFSWSTCRRTSISFSRPAPTHLCTWGD